MEIFLDRVLLDLQTLISSPAYYGQLYLYNFTRVKINDIKFLRLLSDWASERIPNKLSTNLISDST